MGSESVLQRVAAGEESAVKDCLDRYSGLVWSLARRLSPSRADAEDAVQEIFISLWRSAHRFDPTAAKESTFVAMIARRRLIDRIRRSGRRPDNASLVEEAAPANDGGAEATPEIRDEAAEVGKAFRRLSDDQQRVLHLSIHRGYSHSQIAESTGMPLGTVKTHARRGLIRLRKIVEEQEHEKAEASE